MSAAEELYFKAVWTDDLSASPVLNTTLFGPFSLIPSFETDVDEQQHCSASQ